MQRRPGRSGQRFTHLSHESGRDRQQNRTAVPAGVHSRTAMIRTVEATIDDTGDIRLAEPLRITGVHRALVTVLDEPPAEGIETTQMSEPALARDWDRTEEDEAWSHLQ